MIFGCANVADILGLCSKHLENVRLRACRRPWFRIWRICSTTGATKILVRSSSGTVGGGCIRGGKFIDEATDKVAASVRELELLNLVNMMGLAKFAPAVANSNLKKFACCRCLREPYSANL